MNNIRKFINTPEGYGVVFGTSFFLMNLLFFDHSLSQALFMGSVMGFASGYGLTSRYEKEGKSYFVQNVEADKYPVTRRFNKLLRSSQIPADAGEHQEFLKYLDAVEKAATENSGTKGIILMSVIGVLFVLIVAADKLTLFSVLFGIMFGGYAYNTLILSKQKLAKVTLLRKQISHNTQG